MADWSGAACYSELQEPTLLTELFRGPALTLNANNILQLYIIFRHLIQSNCASRAPQHGRWAGCGCCRGRHWHNTLDIAAIVLCCAIQWYATMNWTVCPPSHVISTTAARRTSKRLHIFTLKKHKLKGYFFIGATGLVVFPNRGRVISPHEIST